MIQFHFAATPLKDLEDLQNACLAAKAQPWAFTDPSVLAFAHALSARLLQDPNAKAFPACTAFGFWLRAAALDDLTARVQAGSVGRAPAGAVFLMPPSNVTTLFAYTALLSLLCGNVTLIRLPQTPSAAQDYLLSHFLRALDQAPDSLQQRLFLLGYGHDDAITTALSALADRRFVWGADETIAHIGSLPLPAGAHHIGFGDRFSAATIGAAGYLALDDQAKDHLARLMAADIYSFDQLACSSPRALFWIGSADAAQKARADYYPRLTAAAEARGYVLDAAQAIARRRVAFLALHDLQTQFYWGASKALAVIGLTTAEELEPFKTVSYGFGLLLDACCPSLEAVLSIASARDQTLSYACLPAVPTEQTAYDRMVPVGRALDFDVRWDRIDLIEAMTRQQG